MHIEGVMCESNPETDGICDIAGENVQDESNAWNY